MNQSEHINEIATALAKAQGEIKNPQKNKEVKVSTKTGGSYKFEYADLTAIIDAVKGPLSANGLSYIQTLAADGEKFRLHTRLLHSSGQWLESVTPLFVDGATSQAFGSALTFMKRYALASMLGVAADSDDDANSADGNSATVMSRKPKEPAPSPIPEQPQASVLQSSPCDIPVPTSPEHGERDWLAWGKTFIDTTKESKTEAVADMWLTANQRNLHDMLDEAPKAFARLKSAVAGLYPQVLLDDK